MNIKRTFLTLAAALLLPGLAMAGTTGPATFEVDFDFEDSDPGSTTARISCDGGLPITSEQEVFDNDRINFVVTQVENPTDIDCRVFVDPVAGYVADYTCDSGSSICNSFDPRDNNQDGEGCFYISVDVQDDNECDVFMRAKGSSLTVHKTWTASGNSGDFNFDLETLRARIAVCTNQPGIIQGSRRNGRINNQYCVTTVVKGPDSDSFDVSFTGANWRGNNIDIWERSRDSAVETDMTDCVPDEFDTGDGRLGGFAFEVFNGEAHRECTIENTIFFEGIPTLNQYGLAIMALLMLGVGFVGFRRFV